MKFPKIGSLNVLNISIDGTIVDEFTCEVNNMKRLGYTVKKGVDSFYELVHPDSMGAFGGVFNACKIGGDCSYALKIQYLEDKIGFNNEVYVNEYLMSIDDKCSFFPCFYGSFKCITNKKIREKLNVDVPVSSQVGYMLFQKIDSDLFLMRNKVTFNIMKNIVGKISNLHKLGVIHQDISFSNIFIRDNDYIIGDFGFSIVLNKKYESVINEKVKMILKLNDKEKKSSKSSKSENVPSFMTYIDKSEYVDGLNETVVRNTLILLNKILDFVDLFIDYDTFVTYKNKELLQLIEIIRKKFNNEIKIGNISTELMRTNFMLKHCKFIKAENQLFGVYKTYITSIIEKKLKKYLFNFKP